MDSSEENLTYYDNVTFYAIETGNVMEVLQLQVTER
jgi:hypothetical protein